MPSPYEMRRLDAAALKALAHPLRIDLIDALRRSGPATATMLAKRLGESSGATSYHLRQLARHGLVEQDPDRLPRGRERWWRRVPGGISLAGFEFMQRDDTRAAAGFLIREIQRGRVERLQRWLAEFGTWDLAWQEVSMDADYTLQLSPGQLRELCTELHTAIERYREAGPADAGAHLVEIQVNAFPLVDTLAV